MQPSGADPKGAREICQEDVTEEESEKPGKYRFVRGLLEDTRSRETQREGEENNERSKMKKRNPCERATDSYDLMC